MFKDKQAKRYFALGFVLALLMLLDYLGFFKMMGVRQVVAKWQAKNFARWQQLSQPLINLRQLWQLRSRLEDLEYRYREASVQLGELEALKNENIALKRLLENTDRSLTKTIISRPISSFAKPVIALDQSDVVPLGAMVLGEGILLGLIDEQSFGQARVRLLKDMTEQGILAKTETGVVGIIKGDGRNIMLTEVGSEELLTLNQRVVTLGQEGIAPDILIGRISSLKEQNPAQATQEAMIEQAINFYQLSLVEIQP